MPKVSAIIFDLDGTLVDSEKNYFRGIQKMLKEYGIHEFTEAMNEQYVGMAVKEMSLLMKEKYDIAEDSEVLIEKHDRYYLEFAALDTPAFPEMLELVKALQAKGYPLAIASGSSTPVIDFVAQAAGLLTYFPVRLSSDAVPAGKPSPDVFLKTAEILGVPPAECLVIEDSQHGVEAAKRAGMYCVAVADMSGKGAEERACYAQADICFGEGMDSFSAKEVLNWLEDAVK